MFSDVPMTPVGYSAELTESGKSACFALFFQDIHVQSERYKNASTSYLSFFSNKASLPAANFFYQMTKPVDRARSLVEYYDISKSLLFFQPWVQSNSTNFLPNLIAILRRNLQFMVPGHAALQTPPSQEAIMARQMTFGDPSNIPDFPVDPDYFIKILSACIELLKPDTLKQLPNVEAEYNAFCLESNVEQRRNSLNRIHMRAMAILSINPGAQRALLDSSYQQWGLQASSRSVFGAGGAAAFR